MAGITWFKVLTDIFADDKIKILQSMPEGDSLLVMWFKVLSQAGKTNDGGYIYLKKNIPYTSGMLATLFGKPQQLVELAMRTFTEFGMIDIDDKGYVFVTNWEKHQSIDKMEKIKEQTRLRVSSHREKKKLELMESNANVTLQVTQSNATDIDIEKELKHKTKTKNPIPKREYAEDVFLAESEYAKLLEKYGEPLTLKAIEILSSYKGAKGAKYKSDYKAMLNWVFDEAAKRSNSSISESRTSIPKYSAKDREAELLQKAIQNSKNAQVSMIDFGPRTD